jgi:hypothetical protein
VIWDYTNLINTGFSEDSFANPGTTPPVYQFVFNNFFYPAYDATHAQPGSSIALPAQVPFTITNVFNFYKNTSGSFKMLGFGATINGIPTPIEYQGGDVLYHFPLSFGNMDTSHYSFEVNVPTLGYWKQSGTRTNEVDGFGTLLLPENISYQVIRLRSEVQTLDSVYVEALGFTIPFPRTHTEYKFMAVGEGEPVLTITTQPQFIIAGPETVNTVKYKNEMNVIGVEALNNTGLKVYPNPVSDLLTISNTQDWVWTRLSLFNTLGEVVYTDGTGGTGNIRLDVSSLSMGNYYALVEYGNNQRFTQKISIR